jgi:amidase
MSARSWSRARTAGALRLGLVSALLATACPASPPAVQGPAPVEERSIAELQAELSAGRATSVQLVDAYLARIAALDHGGPTISAVLSLNPRARDDAQALDVERAQRGPRGPLHGIPILIKDNIETADPLATTAGSLALADNRTGRDAPIVARLRSAGAVILGKANLSEWANMRSSSSISGWSALGGLTKNPYSLDRTACGSSAGSGAAVAASLAAAALGTDTSGSIICPAAVNGTVGLKPTVGLLSRRHIVPISHSQDAPGPLGRSVADVALLLSITAGTDAEDEATLAADAHKRDYLAALRLDALQGKRLGVLTFLLDGEGELDALFADARALLREAGAELVDIAQGPSLDAIRAYQTTILTTELKADLARYFATLPASAGPRTLADLIAFNQQHAAEEMPLFAQDLFLLAEQTRGLDDPGYRAAVPAARRAAGPEGIDALLARHHVDALVGPTAGPAWVNATNRGAGGFNLYTTLAAVAGYPQLTVPMGEVGGLPVGISFIGTAWSEADLLAFGHAYEQRAHARRPPTYVAAISAWPYREQRARRWLRGPRALVVVLALALPALFVARALRRRRLSAGRSARTG